MNRILNIPADQLVPGDVIVRSGRALPNIEVVEPGVMPSLPGLVRVCVRENGRLTEMHATTHSRYDIDRPNLVIPGLDRDPFAAEAIMDEADNAPLCGCGARHWSCPGPNDGDRA